MARIWRKVGLILGRASGLASQSPPQVTVWLKIFTRPDKPLQD
ncbi:hypothetical protein [Phormidium yuhuli]|nr:hypothetical protein [Phormidium yuhuli]